MEEDLSLPNSLLDLDQPKLHPRTQLDKPNRAFLAPDALSPVPTPNIVARKPNLALLLVLLRITSPAHSPSAVRRLSVRHVAHLRVGRDESHLFLPEDVVGDIFCPAQIQHAFGLGLARPGTRRNNPIRIVVRRFALGRRAAAQRPLAREGNNLVVRRTGDDLPDGLGDADGPNLDDVVTEVDGVGGRVVGEEDDAAGGGESHLQE